MNSCEDAVCCVSWIASHDKNNPTKSQISEYVSIILSFLEMKSIQGLMNNLWITIFGIYGNQLRTRGWSRGWIKELRGSSLYGLYRYLRSQGVWFSILLVIYRVSILADFSHFGHR